MNAVFLRNQTDGEVERLIPGDKKENSGIRSLVQDKGTCSFVWFPFRGNFSFRELKRPLVMEAQWKLLSYSLSAGFSVAGFASRQLADKNRPQQPRHDFSVG
jgi:hypothetical protein